MFVKKGPSKRQGPTKQGTGTGTGTRNRNDEQEPGTGTGTGTRINTSWLTQPRTEKQNTAPDGSLRARKGQNRAK